MNDDVFHQRPDKPLTDLRRAREVTVKTALTVTGEPAVFIAGKQLRLLLPAEHALRIAHEITDHLAHARELTHTRYRTYTLGQEHSNDTDPSTLTTTDHTADNNSNTTIKENNNAK